MYNYYNYAEVHSQSMNRRTYMYMYIYYIHMYTKRYYIDYLEVLATSKYIYKYYFYL